MVEKINKLFLEMQHVCTNSEGNYHFSELKLPSGADLKDRLTSYLLDIEAYKNPNICIDDQVIIIENRVVENLSLIKIDNIKTTINDKLKFWREHKTGLDTRQENSTSYTDKEKAFQESLCQFISSLTTVNAFTVEGIDTYFAFGKDDINDDIIFETNDKTYVLHFGWSS